MSIDHIKGRVTAYGFRCGYVERYNDDDVGVTLSMENETYLVKGFIAGRHIIRGTRSLALARAMFLLAKSGIIVEDI